MRDMNKGAMCLLLAASAMVSPQIAFADASSVKAKHKVSASSSREAALADRLAKLEAELTALRADVAKNHADQGASAAVVTQVAAAKESAEAATAQAVAATRTAEAANTKASEAATKVAALNSDKSGIVGFRNGNTQVTLSGYVKLIASNARYSGGDDATNNLGRDLYLPQSVPVYNPASPTSPTRVTDFSAKQTRFWVDASTKLGQHNLKAYIEFDFQAAPGTPMALGQGTQRTTNAYDLAMRRAFIQFDRWTLGQDFTNFSVVSVLPESTDYVGGVDGLIFVRQPQIRYSLPLSKGLTLHMSAENPETASATAGAASLIENGEDHLPDFTTRLAYYSSFGQLDLSGLFRQLRVDNAKVGAAHVVDSRAGWGISAAGKVFMNAKHTSDFRFEATYGEGIGRYLGLNFGPDAVLTTAASSLGRLSGVRNLGVYGSTHIGLTDKWRVNLIGSFQHIYYGSDIDHSNATGIGNYNKQAWSAAGNVFYSPIKNIDLGVEYRRGNRELVNGLSGFVDRMDFAAKYTF